MLRRLLFLLALVALLALFAYTFARWGKPRPVAELQGKLLAPPVGDRGALAWLERRPGGDCLVVRQRSRGAPRALLTAAELGGLAVVNGRAYLSRRDREGGPTQMWSVQLHSGRQKALVPIPSPATQIVSGDEWICWLAERPAALPAAPFVVAGGPVTAVWAMTHRNDRLHPVRLLSGSGEAELLAVVSQDLYWAEYSGGTTRVRRQRITGGEVEPLVSEPGRRGALLLGNRLAWTAPSREAALPEQYCSVKTRSLSGGEATSIADWLAPDAVLLRSGRVLYAQERDALWQLGSRRGQQRVLYRASFGGRYPTIIGGVEYLVQQHGKKARLIRRGLTWGGKLRVMLGV
jgi:hypothetical protein